MKKPIINFLSKPLVYKCLIAANLLVILLVFYTGAKRQFPDEIGYLNMARGLGQGNFSSWYFAPVEIPETLRTWGYPFFLLLCQKITDSTLFFKIVQLLMHFAAVWMVLRLIARYTPALVYRNLFLLLLLPNMQVAFYASQGSSETVTIFFLTWFMYVWLLFKDDWKKYILMAVLAFCVFQLRAVFMLFPFGILVYKLLFARKDMLKYSVFCVLFAALLLPFGFWNKKHHGIFKLTPLEGGAGIAHSGFWQFRMPNGYQEKYYWGNIFTTDLTTPAFASTEERLAYKPVYEKEMEEVLRELEQYNTPQDSVNMAFQQQNNPGQLYLHNSRYTIAREKLLIKKTWESIKGSPGFYIKTRIFTFFRTWYTGINKEEFNKASFTGKLKVLFPFLVTFTFILGGLIFIFASILFKRLSWRQYWPFLLVILYFGVMHVPFIIQARYTIPVNLFVLLMASIAAGNWFLHKKNDQIADTTIAG